MGLFGRRRFRRGKFRRRKEDLVYEGIAGTARITALEAVHPDRDDDSTTLSDFGLGTVKYRMTLDVRLDDGRPPYTLEGKYKVPTKLDPEVDDGVTLPVYADPDDPSRVEFNWDAYLADPARAELHDGFDAEERAQVHDAFPDDSRRMMVDGWVTATQGGAMSRADFDAAMRGAVESGMLTLAEVEAATRALGDAGP